MNDQEPEFPADSAYWPTLPPGVDSADTEPLGTGYNEGIVPDYQYTEDDGWKIDEEEESDEEEEESDDEEEESDEE